jgi:hypothetical protein
LKRSYIAGAKAIKRLTKSSKAAFTMTSHFTVLVNGGKLNVNVRPLRI